MSRLSIVRVGLVAFAAVLALAPLPPAAVERWYSTGVFAAFQPAATRASNAVPFVLLDAGGVLLLLWLLAAGVRDVRSRGWIRAAGRTLRRLAVSGAAAYLVFALAWGLNYRRQRLEDRLAFDDSALTAGAAARLATSAVDRLNALHAAAHARGWDTRDGIDPDLAASFRHTIAELVPTRAPELARPKHTVFDWYFERAGVGGMTDPFFLETIVARDLLPFERPFVIAHEWSHLAGLADEGEANLAGWLACVRGEARDQYSGWLFMYGEALGSVPRDERAAVAGRLAEGPRADLRAIRDRVAKQVNPRVSAAGWRVYDSYLKANRIEAGAASYGEVVRLALGLRVARIE